MPVTILLVDDRDDTRSLTRLFLGSFGYVIHSFSNAPDALASFDCRLYDLVLTDNAMPGMTGQELAHIIKMRSPSTPVLMYTGAPPLDCTGLDAIIRKPAQLTVLKEAVEHLIAARQRGSPVLDSNHNLSCEGDTTG